VESEGGCCGGDSHVIDSTERLLQHVGDHFPSGDRGVGDSEGRLEQLVLAFALSDI
jgi:hypothetical protein